MVGDAIPFHSRMKRDFGVVMLASVSGYIPLTRGQPTLLMLSAHTPGITADLFAALRSLPLIGGNFESALRHVERGSLA